MLEKLRVSVPLRSTANLSSFGTISSETDVPIGRPPSETGSARLPSVYAVAPERRRPTPDEPIPSLAGERGLILLRSATAYTLARTTSGLEACQIKATCQVILDSLTPAGLLEVATIIETLALHFPVLRRSEGENRIVARHWADDLADYPADLIEEGARLWRNGAKDRFPTAGQFKALIDPILAHRRLLAKRAAEYLEIVA